MHNQQKKFLVAIFFTGKKCLPMDRSRGDSHIANVIELLKVKYSWLYFLFIGTLKTETEALPRVQAAALSVQLMSVCGLELP